MLGSSVCIKLLKICSHLANMKHVLPGRQLVLGMLGVPLSPNMRDIVLRRGNGTEDDASKAHNTEGIAVLNLEQFTELLIWGILMGVNSLQSCMSCCLPICCRQADVLACTMLVHSPHRTKNHCFRPM